MRALVVFVLLAVCGAAPEPEYKSAASSPTRHTPQELYLAKQNTGNFACKVNNVRVTTESPGDADFITTDMLKASFSKTATLEWAHVAQTSFSAFDGRNEEKVLGTPGGDMGEFIQALHAYTKVSAKELTSEDVLELFERYIKVMTREKFFYQTDEKAYIRLVNAAGCRNLHITEMGGMKHKKAAILSLLNTPEYIGDPFIRFMSANATALDLNPDYIQAALAAYHNVLWTTPSKLSEKLCYFELKGPHKEAALVTIKTPGYCTDQGLAPMVSQQLTCPAPVFIYHVDAVKILRRELVAVMTDGQDDVNPGDMLAVYNVLAEGNLQKFWAWYGAGLGSFQVEFDHSSPLMDDEE